MSKLTTYLSFVRFSHSVFALPFALAGALLAAQHVVVTWTAVGWIVAAMVNPVGPAPEAETVTLLNTMLDYSEPGVLGVFTDEPTVARLERQMAAKGFLEGSQMSSTFDLLRANDLIFSYVASNWLMGGQPPALGSGVGVLLPRRFRGRVRLHPAARGGRDAQR